MGQDARQPCLSLVTFLGQLASALAQALACWHSIACGTSIGFSSFGGWQSGVWQYGLVLGMMKDGPWVMEAFDWCPAGNVQRRSFPSGWVLADTSKWKDQGKESWLAT